jgi:hypothetical protein
MKLPTSRHAQNTAHKNMHILQFETKIIKKKLTLRRLAGLLRKEKAAKKDKKVKGSLSLKHTVIHGVCF